jgi:hypothetical protein
MAPCMPACRVWDLHSGACQAVLTGKEADIRRAEALGWQMRPAAVHQELHDHHQLVAVPTDHSCVDLLLPRPSLSGPGRHVPPRVASVAVLPPHKLHTQFLPLISNKGTRLTVFVQGSSRPLVYELHGSQLEGVYRAEM